MVVQCEKVKFGIVTTCERFDDVLRADSRKGRIINELAVVAN
jgi:hypothetical protein